MKKGANRLTWKSCDNVWRKRWKTNANSTKKSYQSATSPRTRRARSTRVGCPLSTGDDIACSCERYEAELAQLSEGKRVACSFDPLLTTVDAQSCNHNATV